MRTAMNAVAGGILAAALVASAVVPASAEVPSGDPTTYESFPAVADPGDRDEDYFEPLWLDDNGNHIQAHGGQIVETEEDGETVYYWYGEDRSSGYFNSPGVHAYRSTDAMNWTDEGLVLRSVQNADELTGDYFDALYDTVDDAGQPRAERIDELNYHLNSNELADYTTIFERPKVLYNEQTDKWVLWWHSDGRTTPGGSTYARSMAGVAVSDSPTGPFELTGVYRMPNRTGYKACTQAAVPGQARDMTVHQEPDGSAYIVYSSEENRSLYIARLNDDYTNVTHTTDTDMANAHQFSANGEYPYLFADGTAEAPVRGEDFQIVKECGMLEAPAVFTHGDRYYVAASGATGWAPNPQTYHTSDSLMGPWIRGVEADDEHENVAYDAIPEGGDGLLSVGDSRGTTFGSQSTDVFDLGGGRHVYMGDRWNRGEADSTYVWLPITIGENGVAQMRNPAVEDPERWGTGWDASYWEDKGAGDGVWSVVDDRLPAQVAPGEDFGAQLPATVPVDVDGVAGEVEVTWSATRFDTLGEHTITGTLASDDTFGEGRTFTRTIEAHIDGIENLAPSSDVTASSRQELAPTLTDGDVTGKGWDDWVAGGAHPLSSTLEFSWTLPQDVDSVVVNTYQDGPDATWPARIDAEYRDLTGQWVDTEIGVDLAQDPAAGPPVAELDLAGLPATTGVRLGLTTETVTWQSISEVQIWGAASGADVCSADGTVLTASFHQTDWEVMPAEFACDRDGATAWSTWDGEDLHDRAVLTVEPQEAHTLDRVAFTNVEGTIESVGIEYRDAAGQWHPTTAQGVAPAANGSLTTIAFDAVVASAVRLTFETPGSYLKIPSLGIGSGGAEPSTVEAAAQLRCVGAKAHLVVTATNTGGAAADLRVETEYGARTLSGVAPGASESTTFHTRASEPAPGEATVSTAGARATAAYEATACG